MAYDLHITRRKFWADKEGAAIEPAEWLALVEADPELEIDSSGGSSYFAVWGDPRDPVGWIDLHDGDLFSKGPDESLIEKMQAIAMLLGAQVQGDDGEIYPPDGGEPYFQE